VKLSYGNMFRWAKASEASQRVGKLAGQREGPEAMLWGLYLGKKRIFSVIFRGRFSRCGRILALRLSSGIDFKRVKNNLQGLRENLYPRGYRGGRVPRWYKPVTSLTDWTGDSGQKNPALPIASIVRRAWGIFCNHLLWFAKTRQIISFCAMACSRQPRIVLANRRTLADIMGPIRGAACIRRYFLMVDVEQLSRKSGSLVTFTPMSELRDCMVPRLPKQNRQIEEEPRKIPIRSRGKRACCASACLAGSSGA
jgi:hypothetical protein